ncbi:MAG: hypothetical protein JNM80_11090 [Phycisphaerae bacterium]|nr:hypothetical protein [Phycisphaerae bacterium]
MAAPLTLGGGPGGITYQSINPSAPPSLGHLFVASLWQYTPTNTSIVVLKYDTAGARVAQNLWPPFEAPKERRIPKAIGCLGTELSPSFLSLIYVAAEVAGPGGRDFQLMAFNPTLTLAWTSRWGYEGAGGWHGDDVAMHMAVGTGGSDTGGGQSLPYVVVTGTTTEPVGGTDIFTVYFDGMDGA